MVHLKEKHKKEKLKKKQTKKTPRIVKNQQQQTRSSG